MSTPALSIEGLHKTYANGVNALRGIDLTIDTEQAFALLGANGAGKSTTIGIITTLVNPSKGQVRLFGHDITQEPEQAKRLMGVVPQEFNFSIFETAWNTLLKQAGLYGVRRSIAKIRAKQLLQKLDLWDSKDRIIQSFSGGMKRRLMIARALIHEPKLLILDEPTASIDTEMRQFVLDFIESLHRQGTAILLTTHYLEEAERLCQQVAMLHRGQIIEQGHLQTLLKQLPQDTLVLYLATAVSESQLPSNLNARLIAAERLEVEIAQGQSIHHLFQQLSAAQIEVVGVKNKTNRLERLFVDKIQSHSDQP